MNLTPNQLVARMLRASLGLEQWPNDILERAFERALEIADMKLEARRTPAAVYLEPEHPAGVSAAERAAMHARTQRVSAGLEAAPANVVTSFAVALPSAAWQAAEAADLEAEAAAGWSTWPPAALARLERDLLPDRRHPVFGGTAALEADRAAAGWPAGARCTECRHHHAPGTHCGARLEVRWPAHDTPATCQCPG